MSTRHRLGGRWQRTRRGAVLAAWLVFSGGGSLVWAVSAAGQSAAPAIEVAAEIQAAPAVLTPLRIKIIGGGISKQAMLMLRGVPPRVTLTEGRSFGRGVWVVPLASISSLEIAPATGTSGKSEITLELMALDGKILADAKSTLTIAPAGSGEVSAGDPVSLTATPLAGDPQLTGALTPDGIDRLRKLVEKGDESMEVGKITSARLFYKSAAEEGWAPAALALGATYDRIELSRWRVIGGVQPDPALARKWYEKAKELGSPEAELRLRQLGAR